MAFGFPVPTRKVFVVACKRCRREVPAGVPAFPFQSIVVACPLCGDRSVAKGVEGPAVVLRFSRIAIQS
jgi:RNA polymerase subunit RPABC4/transcription elongation factor Spt4